MLYVNPYISDSKFCLFSFLVKKLPDTLKKNDQTLYKVTCSGNCFGVNIVLKVKSGDADLYAR